MPNWPRRHRFWGQIRGRALWTLLFAVGLTFSTMGFLTDVTSLDSQPFSNAFYSGLISGLGAVTVLLGVARSYGWFLATVAVHVAGAWFLSGPARMPPFVWGTTLADDVRLQFDSLVALLTLVSGYTAFISFITRDGRRQVAMRTELALATEMHRALVPRIDTTVGRCTFYGVSEASGQVGGDLVDLVALPGGGWLAYVADVSGHGVSSGLVMGMVKSAVRMGVADGQPLPILLGRLNTLMCSQLKPGTYVTLGFLRGAPDGRVDVLMAGHPPLLRTRADEAGVEALTTDNIPIGIMPEWSFTAASVTLAPGDRLVLVTDGLFEVFDAKDRDLGLEGLKGTVAEARDWPARVLLDGLFARARAFGPQQDDQSALVVECTS